MSYFSRLPKTLYLLGDNFRLATDLMVRVKLRSKVENELTLYTKHNVTSGERPEHIADQFYNDPTLHWIILIVNNITDPFYGWPLSEKEFLDYVNDKYTTPSGAHHYEKTQSSGKQSGDGPSDYSHLIECNSTDSGATAVTNLEYEQREQDRKRQIKILHPTYVDDFIKEFDELVDESII